MPVQRKTETTPLSPSEEMQFQLWARANQIRDVDHPQSYYDYRGYWKQIAARGEQRTKMYDDGLHFTDQFKQHGHPTFSIESAYSSGPQDGGRWVGEDYVPWGADALMTSRGNQRMASSDVMRAIRILAGLSDGSKE